MRDAYKKQSDCLSFNKFTMAPRSIRAPALPASLVICGQSEHRSYLPKTALRSMIEDFLHRLPDENELRSMREVPAASWWSWSLRQFIPVPSSRRRSRARWPQPRRHDELINLAQDSSDGPETELLGDRIVAAGAPCIEVKSRSGVSLSLSLSLSLCQ